MKIQIAACLLSLALLPACSTTTQTTAQHQTLEQRLMAKYANADTAVGEPAPPAEGPEDIPAEGPVTIPTPRAPRETTARPTPHMIGVRESATAAPGSGPGLVWVNTKTHVYHSQKSRWYGTTKEGKYMSEEEAKADGNRPARTSE